MGNDLALTRREALQGIAGVAAAALLPIGGAAERPQKTAPWPADALTNSNRMRAFNDDWRFHSGDSVGAESAGIDDAGWRTLDVPHDWSVEDRPMEADQGEGALWSGGDTPLQAGPFDMYASAGQGSTGWTVGGLGWYR